MRGRRGHGWWLMALVLAGSVPLAAAPARPPAPRNETVIGNITGAPMGTWMTLKWGGSTPMTQQIDLSHAKISEKGKTLKRYNLAEGWKVRVKGTRSSSGLLSADTVEVLERSKPKKP